MAAESDRTGTQRPTVIYDGDCGFCQRSVDRWRRRHGANVEFLPSYDLGERFPDVPRDRFDETVFLVERDGKVREGADAVFTLGALRGPGLLAWTYRHLPPFAALAEWAYRLVARHRYRLGGGECRLPDEPGRG